MRDLLAYRYDARKHTIISSNLGDAEGFFVACGNRAGEWTPRLRRVSTSYVSSLI